MSHLPFSNHGGNTAHATEMFDLTKRANTFSNSSGDHVARSAQLIWGNYIVAGLGSHWAGVKASVTTDMCEIYNPNQLRQEGF